MMNTNAVPVRTESPDYLATLLQLGQLLNSSLELKQVLETAIEQVIAFVGAERGFILLVDVETGRVWGEAVRHIDRAALEATLTGNDLSNRAEISRTVVENVLDTRLPVLSHNAMEDPRFADRQSVQLTHLRSVLCVPLIAQGRLLGVIYLDNRVRTGLFTERHLAMLEAFANQASVAIENARLYDNLRRSLEERLRLQDELHRQETRRLALEEASRLKSDFISFVAHELRNPLTTIRGCVQTLMADHENTLPQKVREEFYESIEADADRLLDMINELLDVSRLEAGRPLTLAIKPVELCPLMEKLARRHRFYKHFTDRHEIVTQFAPGLPRTIDADEDKLNQILSNLLSNAIKYSPNGGVITLSAAPDGAQHVLLSVSDQGVGMSPEQVARLFRQYERVERDEIKNIPGTGLGLYLVKHLVDLHRGEISCESTPGQGSTFRVRLPVSTSEGTGSSSDS
ncbi:MAG: GAF domain-containing sensor histidine kinase [Chloroherpetonaceae bacterium]|nr:GAF domain-containing sensor histidine kinase [Chthonomonadaceae bacterium]MDW8207411.1 GAF domain-containing sensor histidine kinase [Chloroherpetonaceae bacterium]